MKQYLIRLDDACPTMDHAKWSRMELILDTHGMKPMVGVIPANSDPKQQIDNADPEFWTKVKKWESKGWAIALHGYDHCYISEDGLKGLNPIWSRSEFAGVSLEQQKEKIRKGVDVFCNYGIKPKYFFAPSHTFDENTLNALRLESDIRIISDTIATYPYRYKDFIFIPQFGGSCKEMPFNGIFTFCFHPSTMDETQFDALQKFLEDHYNEFISFDDINLSTIGRKSLFSKLLSCLYFIKRKIR